MKQSPIGVFDSGIGGLTVLKEIKRVLPNEDIVYFGDTARVPYGSRSKETVTKYTFQCINFLLTNKIKAIVIACNTATARSLEIAQQKYDIPIMGVIEAGARTAIMYTKNKKVGVIGTEGTINSKAYEIEIHKKDKDIEILGKACPLFVPLVEEGWNDTDIALMAAQRYLSGLKDKNIDSLVLGCTHYPLLTKTISSIMGEDIKLVNPARETAKDLERVLQYKNLLNDKKTDSVYNYYVSDNPSKFKSVGEQFLNEEIGKVDVVEIHKY